MITQLIEIIDRLISLKKIQIDRRRNVFDKVIEGVFDELLLIHGDYVSMFKAAAKLGSTGKRKSLENVQNALSDMRSKFEPIRVKLRQLLATLDTDSLPVEEQDFVIAVISYFPKGVITNYSTSTTQILEAIEDLSRDEFEYLDNQEKANLLVRMIEHEINRLHDRWKNVCTAYAHLKIAIARL